MKILHIVPSYLPATRYGGPIQSVHNLNRALVRKGAEVTVYTTNANGPKRLDVPLGEPIDMDGVKVFYFPVGLPAAWYYSRELKKALKNNVKNFDIVHITSTFLSASAFGAHYAKKAGIPYIISPRGNLMRAPLSVSRFKKKIYINLIERRNLAGAAAIDFTSIDEERDYLRGGFPLKHSIVLPNGIKMPDPATVSSGEISEFKKEVGFGAGETIISCLGRISKIKGFDTLIPAFADLALSGIRTKLLIIGGDDEKGYKKEVEKLISERGLGEAVVFAGMLTGHKKDIALKASDILAQPSESESFGMSSAEAMAMGIPVIVTEGVGVSSIVAKANAGLVIKKNSEELARAIKCLLSDEKLRVVMGENGRNAAEKNLSEESIAERFIFEYRKIIEGNKKGIS